MSPWIDKVYHFSEDPNIEVFHPHVPRTNPSIEPYVWAIDEAHAPLYWFPRDCPRATVWADTAEDQNAMAERFLTSAWRIHAVESVWHESIVNVRLYRYSFGGSGFSPYDAAFGHWVSEESVTPESVEPVGDLINRHFRSGIELRFVNEVEPFWNAVISSGLPFSGVRLQDATTPREPLP